MNIHHRWYTSYFSNKTFISTENAYSDKTTIKCGVSQDSILAPLLFLIDINDTPQTEYSESLYADDTYLIFQHKDIKTVKEHLNGDFLTLVDWFVDNKLSVHFGEGKIKSILFCPKKKKINRTKRSLTKTSKLKQYLKVA